MVTGIVYYCWSCDGHCRAIVSLDQSVSCPRCGKLLPEDCRVAHSPKKAPVSSLLEAVGQTPYESRPLAAAS